MVTTLLLMTFGLAVLLTGWMRRYALQAKLLDHPNARSSHSVPTPRGGGVAFVLSFMGAACVLAWVEPAAGGLVAALLGGGGLVAVVGYLDDRRHLPASWRLAAHAAATGWVLWQLEGIPPLPIFGTQVDLGRLGVALAAVYLVWMINLCNFMDGIDGIAGVEAVTVALGGAFVWWLATATPLWTVPAVFAAAVAGFLVWNFPPAKIFMGDAGSGFIGLVLGLLSLWSAQQAPPVFWCWVILLGGFVVDATTTLLRRVRRGEKVHEAHRNHAYQHASRVHRSHKRITLAFAAVNLFWLLPLSALVALGRLDGAAGALIAYVPLVLLAYRYKAGDRSAQEVSAA